MVAILTLFLQHSFGQQVGLPAPLLCSWEEKPKFHPARVGNPALPFSNLNINPRWQSLLKKSSKTPKPGVPLPTFIIVQVLLMMCTCSWLSECMGPSLHCLFICRCGSLEHGLHPTGLLHVLGTAVLTLQRPLPFKACPSAVTRALLCQGVLISR